MMQRLFAWAAVIGAVAAIALAVSAITRGEHPQDSPDTGGGLAAGLRAADGTPWQRMTRKIRDANLPTSGQEALMSSFAPLRTRPEHMSRVARRRALSAVGAPPDALALDHAQLITSNHGNLWLTAGHGLVCVFQTRTFALACDVVATVLKRGLFLGTVQRPSAYTSHRQRFLLIGVVPDRVRRVRLRAGAQSPQQISVHHNTVSADAREPIIVRALD